MQRDLEGRVLVVRSDIANAERNSAAVSLGDIMRLAVVLAHLRARRIYWLVDRDIFSLVSGVSDRFERRDTDLGLDADLVLDIGNSSNAGQAIALRDIIGGPYDKNVTYNLVDRLCGYFGLDPSEIKYPSSVVSRKIQRIGFCHIVPSEWSIKELPRGIWNQVEEELESEFEVVWQPPGIGIEQYVDWIANCDLIVSVVGLGCHIAMMKGIPVVMLAGPTDFLESSHSKSIRSLFPSSPCPYRPCNLPHGVANCGCMAQHDYQAIVAAVREFSVPGSNLAGSR